MYKIIKCIKCKYFKQYGDWATDGHCLKAQEEEDCKGPYKSAIKKEADSWGA